MPNQIGNVHDSMFKQVLGDPELACTFLREHLPPEVVSLLGPEAPEPVPGTFVDEELRQHHSDLLFRLRLKINRDAFAYVLVEHKSSPDPGARLQLLRYVVRLLTDRYERNKQRLPLPPVLPLLVHQGSEGWKLSCEFTDLFGPVPAPLQPYLPSFRHALVDLAPMDNCALSSTVRLRAFLKALKYGRRRDLEACVGVVLAEISDLGDNDAVAILTYIESCPTLRNKSVIDEALQRLIPDRKERIMGCLTQPYYEKGRVEFGAKFLTRFLEKRFGELPTALRQRIFAADAAVIDAWLEQAFDGQDLQAIFDRN